MKKKIILGIVFVLLVGMVNLNTFAQSEQIFSEQLSFLIKLGAMSADGDLSQGAKIKRDRFAKEFMPFINRLSSIDSSIRPQKSYYYDVGLDNEYLPYINYLTENGYLIGDQQNNFHPNEYMTNTEMIKCVVAAAGYTVSVTRPQDLNGYLSVAGNLGLTKGISVSEDATTESMVQLFYNALEVNVMERSLSEAGSFVVNKKLTYLEKTFGVYWIKGQIDGNYMTTLNGKSSTMLEDRVTIDGASYLLSDENLHLADYIGYKMKIYYRENGPEREIIAYQNDQTEELVISAEQLDGLSDYRLYYTVGNEAKQRKVSIASNAVVFFNGVVVKSYNPEIFSTLKNGSVELLCPDSSSVYSIIKIYSYDTYVTKSVSVDTNRIFTTPRKNAEGIYVPTVFDLDKYSHVFIRSAAGMKLKIPDLKENHILSVGESEDKTVIYITVETKAVSGTIEMVFVNDDGNKCYKIAGAEYELDADYINNTEWEAGNGTLVTAYLTYKNKIATIVYNPSATDSWIYGYMMNIIKDEVEETYKIKIFTTTGKVVMYDLKKKALVDGQNMEKLTDTDGSEVEDVIEYFRQGDVYEGAVLKKAKAEFLPQLIRYQLSGSVVTKIDSQRINAVRGESKETTLSLDQPDNSYQYFWGSKQFAAPANGGYAYSQYGSLMRVNDKTLTFFVPNLATGTEAMYAEARSNETVYSIKIGSGYFQDAQTYRHLSGYDIDAKNGAFANVLVSADGESDKWEGNIVIQNVERALNEEDMECIKIVGYNMGSAQTTTYILDWSITHIDDFKNSSKDKTQPDTGKTPNMVPIEGTYGLKRGDIIRIKTVFGKVTKIARYFSPNFLERNYIMDHGVIQSDGTYMGTAGAATDTVMVGVITHANGNYINFHNINPKLVYNGTGPRPTIGQLSIDLGNTAIYKYNAASGKLEMIDKASVSNYVYGISNSAYAYVYTNALVLKTIVIYE